MIAIEAGPDPTSCRLVAIVSRQQRGSTTVCCCLLLFFFCLSFLLSFPSSSPYTMPIPSSVVELGNYSQLPSVPSRQPIHYLPYCSHLASPSKCAKLSVPGFTLSVPTAAMLGRLGCLDADSETRDSGTGCLRPLASLKIQYRANAHRTPHAPRLVPQP